VQQFGRLALLFFLARVRRHAGHALEQRLVRLILFDNVCEDEGVSVAGKPVTS